MRTVPTFLDVKEHKLHFKLQDGTTITKQEGTLRNGNHVYSVKVDWLDDKGDIVGSGAYIVRAKTEKVAFEILEGMGQQFKDMDAETFTEFKLKNAGTPFYSALTRNKDNKGVETREVNIFKPHRLGNQLESAFGEKVGKEMIVLDKSTVKAIKDYAKVCIGEEEEDKKLTPHLQLNNDEKRTELEAADLKKLNGDEEALMGAIAGAIGDVDKAWAEGGNPYELDFNLVSRHMQLKVAEKGDANQAFMAIDGTGRLPETPIKYGDCVAARKLHICYYHQYESGNRHFIYLVLDRDTKEIRIYDSNNNEHKMEEAEILAIRKKIDRVISFIDVFAEVPENMFRKSGITPQRNNACGYHVMANFDEVLNGNDQGLRGDAWSDEEYKAYWERVRAGLIKMPSHE